MTIRMRLSGEPDEINHLVAHLRRDFEVAGADRAYPNRGSFGVRVYLETRPHTQQHGPGSGPAASVDPLDVLTQLFSDDVEPHNMLATAFETDAMAQSSSDELAAVALDTIRRYLHDCATSADTTEPAWEQG